MASLTLRQRQSIFLRNVAKLIAYAFDELGVELTGGELYRTAEQQAIHVKNGLSKVKMSRHQQRLAIDLNLFIDGKYVTETEKYKPLAEYWKSLHPENRAGYDFGWDGNHFEMR